MGGEDALSTAWGAVIPPEGRMGRDGGGETPAAGQACLKNVKKCRDTLENRSRYESWSRF